VKLNATQESKFRAIANDAGYTGFMDTKSVRDWKKFHAVRVKAADKMLAILAPPKAPPIKIGGLGSA
jgi:hypothetical protein